ncbi:MAG: hypothetical protein ACRDJC_26920, partial [Thermomicrobiales bacterium]
FKLIAALGLAGMIGLAGRSDMPSASAMSCFAVAGNLTCIDTAPAPVVPFVPPVMVPSGVGIEGDDEHIVIRDNGGRHIARG